jgi:hypothetical protein
MGWGNLNVAGLNGLTDAYEDVVDDPDRLEVALTFGFELPDGLSDIAGGGHSASTSDD